eukprot:CAMPEP_0184414400 /NCGR_PEP_ID=MMETSP0738-20130409/7985_1 /TAXON_ID=385413 /ORGANISM="Thalassiosira miniscula, Strain CCMP1093" /LENGTH=105 /DNA_ID=CAMNT_0026773399 /DNA_START=43 /DNA_END=357 /DNA_ORIENTATION=+
MDVVGGKLDQKRFHIKVVTGPPHQALFDLLTSIERRHSVQIGAGTRRRGGGVGHFLGGGFGDFDRVKIHLKRFGHNLGNFGVESLPHLGATMVQHDGAKNYKQKR